MSLTHTIERQIVDVTMYGLEADGKSATDELSILCSGELPTLMNAALSELGDLADVVIIERLEVEVHTASLDDLIKDVRDAVVQTIRSLVVSMQEQQDLPGISLLHPQAAFARALAHYLRHGRLPWWYKPESDLSMELLIRRELLDQPTNKQLFNQIMTTLQSSSSARLRLTQQFSVDLVKSLVARLDPRENAVLERAFNIAAPLRNELNDSEALDASIVYVAIDNLFGPRSAEHNLEGLAREIVRVALTSIEANLSATDRIIAVRFLETELASHDTPPTDEVGGLPVSTHEVVILDDADAVGIEGLFVANAGVIIVHPFLPQLFNVIGVSVDNELTNPSRAALLIHHLATGEYSADEHQLVLAKILCGVPVEYPLRREPPVTEREAQECTVLLEAVVEHWSVLRNTTADGLRGNFLSRAGKLELSSDGWLLYVERQSFDILLDHLPWSIGHVQLPWMRSLIRVEWPS